MNLKGVFVIGLLMFIHETTCFKVNFKDLDSINNISNDYESSEEITAVVIDNKLKEDNDCPENFVLLGDQCYYISTAEELDWFDANSKCESLGADLAQIKSEEEMMALNKHLDKLHLEDRFWIAGIDSDTDGRFECNLNGESITYTKWDTGEPTTTFENNCLRIQPGDDTYVMSDFNCIREASFICKAQSNETKLKKICPEKFSLVGNKCYFVDETKRVDRFIAKTSCLVMGAELTKIENKDEMKAINDHLIHLNSNSFWIAGSDLQSEGDYYWDNIDNKMTYTKWAPGQPDKYDPYEHCVNLFLRYDSYYMNDLNCYSNLPYICETKPKDSNEVSKLPIETITKKLKPLPTDKSCPNDFSKVGNKCYFVENAKKSNWYSADRSCKKVKSDLVSIESSDEMELLAKHLQSLDESPTAWSWALHDYWTAANDLGSEGEFHWQSNGQKMSYAKWFPREPNNTANKEHCANLKYYDDGYYMNDDTCEKEMFYICETKPFTPELPNHSLELGIATCAELDLLKLNLESQTKLIDMMYSKEGCSKMST